MNKSKDDTKTETIKEFINILNKFSKDEIIEIESKLDKQYLALEKLYESLKDPELFFKLVITNALLSYYLNMKGEKYWQKFAEFFSRNPDYEKFPEFLEKYNYRLLSQKLKRFEKIKKVVKPLTLENFDYFANNTKNFVEFLSKKLNQKKESKTIVFAAKMLIYAYRIVGKSKIFPQRGIMVPLDVRIKKISNDLNFWRELEKRIPFSLLNLDGIVWILFDLKDKEIDNSNLKKETKEKLKSLKNVIKKLAE